MSHGMAVTPALLATTARSLHRTSSAVAILRPAPPLRRTQPRLSLLLASASLPRDRSIAGELQDRVDRRL